ncbi:MAG: UPF0175 family protein [Bacteroidia bacterium]
MNIEISDKLLKQTGFTGEDLLLHLAIILFEEEKITLGQAAELAKMHQSVFQLELSQRNIPIHYSQAEYLHDRDLIKTLK